MTPGAAAMNESALRWGYDLVGQTLQVTLNTGAIYEFQEVPPGKYVALFQARSKGEYFETHILNCHAWKRIV
jgi:hypothetical protein